MPSTLSPDLSDLTMIHAVRSADPLSADGPLRRLPELNHRADIPALVSCLRELVPHPAAVASFPVHACLAAMRDLGIVLGSLKRHGVEPASAVPEVAPALLALGHRTDMVPRDTLYHYALWNPRDERCRGYLDDPQERVLQESVRMVLPGLRGALDLCDQLAGTSPADPVFAPRVHELDTRLHAMVTAIDLVADQVTPEFFARQIRPYYEAIIIDGQTLLGPAAAQVPLWLVDQAVWASDRGAPDYDEFVRHLASYSLPRWRAYHRRWASAPSLVSRLAMAYDGRKDAEAPALDRSARALAGVLRTVLTFRGRHLGVARRAYRADLRLYPRGSGGATVDLLRQVIDLTRLNAHQIAATARIPGQQRPGQQRPGQQRGGQAPARPDLP